MPGKNILFFEKLRHLLDVKPTQAILNILIKKLIHKKIMVDLCKIPMRTYLENECRPKSLTQMLLIFNKIDVQILFNFTRTYLDFTS